MMFLLCFIHTSINIKIKKIVIFRMLKGNLIGSNFVEKNTFHVVKFNIVYYSLL